MSAKDTSEPVVKATLSKTIFPEICPVCGAEAEDFVSITYYASGEEDDKGSLTMEEWGSSKDSIGAKMATSRGAVLFWVPTCIHHGSKSMTTSRTMMIAIIGFMLLFYPLLFYGLGILSAIYFNRPIFESLIPVLIILGALIALLFYGFYPRSLQRQIRVLSTNPSSDEVYLIFRNTEYQQKFLELNIMHAEVVDASKTEEF